MTGYWCAIAVERGLAARLSPGRCSLLGTRAQRFLQTGIALLGVGVLAELILYPIGSLMQLIGPDRLRVGAAGTAAVGGLIWYLLACANIWRSALDSGIALGVVVSVGYLLLSILLEQQLLPDA